MTDNQPLVDAIRLQEMYRTKSNQLRAALNGLLERYCSLVNSGDCGFWEPEQEEPVKAARAALEQSPAETYRAVVDEINGIKRT